MLGHLHTIHGPPSPPPPPPPHTHTHTKHLFTQHSWSYTSQPTIYTPHSTTYPIPNSTITPASHTLHILDYVDVNISSSQCTPPPPTPNTHTHTHTHIHKNTCTHTHRVIHLPHPHTMQHWIQYACPMHIQRTVPNVLTQTTISQSSWEPLSVNIKSDTFSTGQSNSFQSGLGHQFILYSTNQSFKSVTQTIQYIWRKKYLQNPIRSKHHNLKSTTGTIIFNEHDHWIPFLHGSYIQF